MADGPRSSNIVRIAFGSPAEDSVERTFASLARIEPATASGGRRAHAQRAEFEAALARLNEQLVSEAWYRTRFTWLAAIASVVLVLGGVGLTGWSASQPFPTLGLPVWIGVAGSAVGAVTAGLAYRSRQLTRQRRFLSEVVSKRMELLEEINTFL